MLLKTVSLLAVVAQVLALENGLLLMPPMGWLSWERFRCNVNCDEDPKNCISEWLFMEMADWLAQDGWRDLGYVYVNIDDCWLGSRDDKGRLVPDPKRFPNGIAHLAAYEKFFIEVFLRPLSDKANALVFFSRRTDMPYHYQTSLANLNFTGSHVYETPQQLCT